MRRSSVASRVLCRAKGRTWLQTLSRHSYTASLEIVACDAFLYIAHGGGEINCRLFKDAVSSAVAVYCRTIRNGMF